MLTVQNFRQEVWPSIDSVERQGIILRMHSQHSVELSVLDGHDWCKRIVPSIDEGCLPAQMWRVGRSCVNKHKSFAPKFQISTHSASVAHPV